MKQKLAPITFVFCFLFCLLLSMTASASPWVTAYYGGWWTQAKGNFLRPNQIDYSVLSHIIYFGLIAHPDGTVSLAENFVDSKESQQLIELAHHAKKKVLISVTSPNPTSNRNFSIHRFIDEKHIEAFANNVVQVVQTLNYDGVDIDWEPLVAEDSNHYTQFIHSLRTKLDALSSKTGKAHYLITAAAFDIPELFAKIQNEFDQINIMAYDLSGLWLNETWHNTPLYSPNDDLPSVDQTVKDFETAGVDPKKLGVGIDFYGYQWASQTEKIMKPQQTWHANPDIDSGVSYTDIVTKFIPMSHEKWDSQAQVPYLSHGVNNGESFFLTYDNAASCKAKLNFVVSKGLGGIMAWELGGQWLPDAKVKDPLLQALRFSKSMLKKSR